MFLLIFTSILINSLLECNFKINYISVLQRMGTVHGEELPYIFGAPLVDGFSHFPRNYTRAELALSESFIILMANFVRTG